MRYKPNLFVYYCKDCQITPCVELNKNKKTLDRSIDVISEFYFPTSFETKLYNIFMKTDPT